MRPTVRMVSNLVEVKNSADGFPSVPRSLLISELRGRKWNSLNSLDMSDFMPDGTVAPQTDSIRYRSVSSLYLHTKALFPDFVTSSSLMTISLNEGRNLYLTRISSGEPSFQGDPLFAIKNSRPYGVTSKLNSMCFFFEFPLAMSLYVPKSPSAPFRSSGTLTS